MKKFSIFSIIMLGVVMSALASFQVNAIAFNIKNTTSYRLYFAFYSNDRDYPLLNDTKTPGSANINRGLAPGEVKVVWWKCNSYLL